MYGRQSTIRGVQKVNAGGIVRGLHIVERRDRKTDACTDNSKARRCAARIQRVTVAQSWHDVSLLISLLISYSQCKQTPTYVR